MLRQIQKAISIVILMAFITTSIKSPAYAQMIDTTPHMPAPGVMVHLSPEFTPALLKGIVIHPENALKFDFIVAKGDRVLTIDQKKQEYTKLIKYFLASLAVPDEDQWVNLSPYEKDRIIKDDFGKTEMGRDLLAQDYMLKQITASLIYPEDGFGRKFWDKIYAQAYKQYGTTTVPVNTFNKVWIVPDEAQVYEKGNAVFLIKSHLKVMLEEDYLSLAKHSGITSKVIPESTNVIPAKVGIFNKNNANILASQIVREIILPALEKEVNQGQNFAALRQVFSGMILAAWYKRALKGSLLGKIYDDKSKVKGVDQDPKNNREIYQQYLKAFKKGVFNFIKEDVDKYTNETIPRKYFSGGVIHLPAGLPTIAPKAAGSAAMRVILSEDEIVYSKLRETNESPSTSPPNSAMTVSELNKSIEEILGKHNAFLLDGYLRGISETPGSHFKIHENIMHVAVLQVILDILTMMRVDLRMDDWKVPIVELQMLKLRIICAALSFYDPESSDTYRDDLLQLDSLNALKNVIWDFKEEKYGDLNLTKISTLKPEAVLQLFSLLIIRIIDEWVKARKKTGLILDSKQIGVLDRLYQLLSGTITQQEADRVDATLKLLDSPRLENIKQRLREFNQRMHQEDLAGEGFESQIEFQRLVYIREQAESIRAVVKEKMHDILNTVKITGAQTDLIPSLATALDWLRQRGVTRNQLSSVLFWFRHGDKAFPQRYSLEAEREIREWYKSHLGRWGILQEDMMAQDIIYQILVTVYYAPAHDNGDPEERIPSAIDLLSTAAYSQLPKKSLTDEEKGFASKVIAAEIDRWVSTNEKRHPAAILTALLSQEPQDQSHALQANKQYVIEKIAALKSAVAAQDLDGFRSQLEEVIMHQWQGPMNPPNLGEMARSEVKRVLDVLGGLEAKDIDWNLASQNAAMSITQRIQRISQDADGKNVINNLVAAIAMGNYRVQSLDYTLLHEYGLLTEGKLSSLVIGELFFMGYGIPIERLQGVRVKLEYKDRSGKQQIAVGVLKKVRSLGQGSYDVMFYRNECSGSSCSESLRINLNPKDTNDQSDNGYEAKFMRPDAAMRTEISKSKLQDFVHYLGFVSGFNIAVQSFIGRTSVKITETNPRDKHHVFALTVSANLEKLATARWLSSGVEITPARISEDGHDIRFAIFDKAMATVQNEYLSPLLQDHPELGVFFHRYGISLLKRELAGEVSQEDQQGLDVQRKLLAAELLKFYTKPVTIIVMQDAADRYIQKKEQPHIDISVEKEQIVREVNNLNAAMTSWSDIVAQKPVRIERAEYGTVKVIFESGREEKAVVLPDLDIRLMGTALPGAFTKERISELIRTGLEGIDIDPKISEVAVFLNFLQYPDSQLIETLQKVMKSFDVEMGVGEIQGKNFKLTLGDNVDEKLKELKALHQEARGKENPLVVFVGTSDEPVKGIATQLQIYELAKIFSNASWQIFERLWGQGKIQSQESLENIKEHLEKQNVIFVLNLGHNVYVPITGREDVDKNGYLSFVKKRQTMNIAKGLSTEEITLEILQKHAIEATKSEFDSAMAMVNKSPDWSLDTMNVHPLNDPSREGRNLLDAKQANLLISIAEGILGNEKYRKLGDSDMFDLLREITKSGVSGIIKGDFFRHDTLNYLGGALGNASSSGKITFPTELLRDASNNYEAEQTLKATLLHEANHILDFRNPAKRLGPGVLESGDRDLIERSAIVRASAYFDGFIETKGRKFAVFYKYPEGEIGIETTAKSMLTRSRDNYQMPELSSYERPMDYYHKLAKGDGSRAMMVSESRNHLGGIDMNAAHLKLQIKRDGNGVPLPTAQQDLENIHIDGLIPVILDIRPASDSPLISELQVSQPQEQAKI